MFARRAFVLIVLLVAIAAGPTAHAQARPFVFSPYKDVLVHRDGSVATISIATRRGIVPAVEEGKSNLPAGIDSLTWAFATGECGVETWGSLRGQEFADANVQSFVRAGVDYIVSTGGAEGVFTCGSDEGMERFIARYASPRLVGIDFDIELDQSDAMIDSLVRRVQAAQRRRPGLRFSFTLATFAAPDGSLRSLNATGEKVMRAIRNAGLKRFLVNLMVMNYDATDARTCVVTGGRCNMERSAIQAALNVHRKYSVPLRQIELTAMIGVNDVVANVFSPADALAIARAVRQQKLGGLHFWSLDRDTPCPASNRVSSTCHSLPGLPDLVFSAAFVTGLR